MFAIEWASTANGFQSFRQIGAACSAMALSKDPSRRRSRGDDNPPLLREPCRRRRDGDCLFGGCKLSMPAAKPAPYARVFCGVVWVTRSLRRAQACKRQGLKPEGAETIGSARSAKARPAQPGRPQDIPHKRSPPSPKVEEPRHSGSNKGRSHRRTK